MVGVAVAIAVAVAVAVGVGVRVAVAVAVAVAVGVKVGVAVAVGVGEPPAPPYVRDLFPGGGLAAGLQKSGTKHPWLLAPCTPADHCCVAPVPLISP